MIAFAEQALANEDTVLAIPLALTVNRNEHPSILAQRVLAEAAYAPGARLRIEAHPDRVLNVVYSPDGQTALSSSDDKTLILWDVATGQPIRTLEGHTDTIRDVVFSPDGKSALSTSEDGAAILWDVESGEARHYFHHGGRIKIYGVAFSPDGKTALSASDDDTLVLWRIDSLGDLIEWTNANRYIRDFTAKERERYQIEPLSSLDS